MATAITYSTTGRKGDLRTVIMDVRNSIVLLPHGRMAVMWDEVLGQSHDDDTFVGPS